MGLFNQAPVPVFPSGGVALNRQRQRPSAVMGDKGARFRSQIMLHQVYTFFSTWEGDGEQQEVPENCG